MDYFGHQGDEFGPYHHVRWYEWLICILVILMAVAVAKGQKIPDGPKPQKTPIVLHKDFLLSHGAMAAASAYDIYASAIWAGKGIRPCAVEGNVFLRNHNGAFNVKRGVVIFSIEVGSVTFVDWAVLKAFPHSKTARFISNVTPSIFAGLHAWRVAQWYQMCN